ncbi:peroxiredoxin [Roseibacterium sp. SDUM158017]|uniref:peroxiredoxin n=1 Tax=Roseicyclus salinarum TaxID=3036773 RepID=UPI0024158764|nr:peroxiredoxin [Roseibacterium sp. SDUM158017]MDG4648965.1 peroxiredoxin [Roseibacterium sp. SDUM158017]
MTLEIGTKFPDAGLVTLGEDGPKTVALQEYVAGRKVVVFGLPGAFTGPCSTSHLPSFIRTAGDFRAKGIDEIICIAVNDPFVLKAWGEATGATEAGITLLGDADGALTRTLGMDFTAPPIGLYGRSNRYAVVLDDGVVTHANIDEPNTCDISRGEQLLETL